MESFMPGFAIVALVFVGLEWGWGRRRDRPVYDTNETLATLGVIAGMRVSRLLAVPWMLAALQRVEPYQLVPMEASVPVFVMALVVTDFVFYWHHRWSHEVAVLWTLHQTHHSAEHLNLLSSGRLNWLGPWVIQPLLSLPLVWVGFPAEVVVGVAAFDLVFQFFLHTEAIPRIPWLEGWLNTAAAHRFHHARNDRCLDVNYAGIFVIWDRLFGTWVEPDLPVDALDYGLTSGSHGHNPVWLVVGGMVRWVRGQAI